MRLRSLRVTITYALAIAATLELGARPAAAELASLVSQTESGAPSIIFYHPLCDVEAAGDCAVVEFICGDYAGLTMWLNDFDDTALGNWLIAGGARSTASTSSETIDFQTYEIDWNELNQSWNLKLYAIQEPTLWIKSAGDDPKITITTGKSDVIVPDSEKGIADLRSFAASCEAG